MPTWLSMRPAPGNPPAPHPAHPHGPRSDADARVIDSSLEYRYGLTMVATACGRLRWSHLRLVYSVGYNEFVSGSNNHTILCKTKAVHAMDST